MSLPIEKLRDLSEAGKADMAAKAKEREKTIRQYVFERTGVVVEEIQSEMIAAAEKGETGASHTDRAEPAGTSGIQSSAYYPQDKITKIERIIKDNHDLEIDKLHALYDEVAKELKINSPGIVVTRIDEAEYVPATGLPDPNGGEAEYPIRTDEVYTGQLIGVGVSWAPPEETPSPEPSRRSLPPDNY